MSVGALTPSRSRLLLSFVAAIALHGCAMRVSGFVTDSTTGDPLAGAWVSIGDNSVTVDSAGHYVIRARLNTYDRFVFSARGYESQSIRIKTRDVRYPKLDVQLVPRKAPAESKGPAPAQ